MRGGAKKMNFKISPYITAVDENDPTKGNMEAINVEVENNGGAENHPKLSKLGVVKLLIEKIENL